MFLVFMREIVQIHPNVDVSDIQAYKGFLSVIVLFLLGLMFLFFIKPEETNQN